MKESLASVTVRGLQAPSRPRASKVEKGLPSHPSVCVLAHTHLFLSDSSTGIVTSNARDNNTGATYPHLNFSIPITVLQPALQRYSQTGDVGGLRDLDHAAEPVRVVWRLQRPPVEAPRSKL